MEPQTIDSLSLDRSAGSLHHLAGRAGNLGPDAVTGDQRDRAHGKRWAVSGELETQSY